jgi:two-component system nitrate/nitrite response regulator NarL
VSRVIDVAVIEDHRVIVTGLRAWTGMPSMRVTLVAATVDELLGAAGAPFDVVLLDLALRRDPDPAGNVRRLTGAGHSVLAVDWSAQPEHVRSVLEAGAWGYFARYHDPAALARLVGSITSGPDAPASAAPERPALVAGGTPASPVLSEREHYVLMAYTSGMTMASTARHLGISTETAKTYIKRVKAKCRDLGHPVYTKLDLAEMARGLPREPTAR